MDLRGKASLCRACGLVFTTTSGFDKHRVGEYDLEAPDYGRRCLSPDELAARGWAPNRHGRWARPGGLFNRAQSSKTGAIGQGPLPECR